jgi:hypothetical protein
MSSFRQEQYELKILLENNIDKINEGINSNVTKQSVSEVANSD